MKSAFKDILSAVGGMDTLLFDNAKYMWAAARHFAT